PVKEAMTMTKESKIRERLRKAANEILARSDGIREAIATVDPAGNLSFEEHGTEREFDDVLEQLGDRSRRELVEAAAAFRRVEEGTYGRCAGCGKEVGAERLEALPFTEFCVKCAEDR